LKKQIIELGGFLPGRLNISINEIAAHYSPTKGDDTKIKEGDLVTLDIGVAVDGYIADTAISFCLDDSDKDLVEATEKAVEAALKIVKVGVDVDKIAGKNRGKLLREWDLSQLLTLLATALIGTPVHADPKIPNHKGEFHYELQEGDVIAIEPFATRGQEFYHRKRVYTGHNLCAL